MNIVVETGRLLLRCFTSSDAALLLELNNDPEVTRFTYDLITDLKQAEENLEKNILPQYALYNYGRWAVHIKSTGKFIGCCGLKYRPVINEVDLGYRFKKSFWGKGYATEAAAACIRYGFEKLNLNRITGRAETENQASWKVLEKCNMQYTGMDNVDGHLVRVYEIRNPLVH